MTLNKLYRLVRSSNFPMKCISCGEIIPEGEWLCDYCHEMAEIVDVTKRCLACGLEKGKCDCSHSVYHFNSLVAPYYNYDDGVMQRAFYYYKLSNRMHYHKFFADKMSLCVKNEYRHIKFDGVCYVPSSFRSKCRRGFDQSKLLARRISVNLGIPLLKGEIRCKSFDGIQHALSKDERFKNVRGKYSCKNNNTGKVILLVDDIKTTGATLDECARMLLYSGAYEVHCVTALVTNYNKKGTEKNNGN